MRVFFFFLKEPCLGTETGQKLNVDLGVFYIDNNYDQGKLITDFNLDSKQLETSRPYCEQQTTVFSVLFNADLALLEERKKEASPQKKWFRSSIDRVCTYSYYKIYALLCRKVINY